MKKPGFFLALILVLFVYTSCGDASLFSTTDLSSYKIVVDSCRNGSIVKAGDNINLKIVNPENDTSATRPTNLMIILKNTLDGRKIAESTLQPVRIDEKLSFNFTDIATGEYQLSLILNSDENILTETDITIFYTEGEYKINSINSLPSLISPGAKVLLSAELSLPENANPYLKWSSNGVMLNKGSWNDGLNQIDWQAPKEEGVYTVTLEVFPVRPVEGDLAGYNSPLIMNIELYVTSQREISERELYPLESYYALFHLNDNLKDSVREWEKANRSRGPDRETTSLARPGTGSNPETMPGTGSNSAAGGTEATAIGELKAISLGKEMGYQLNGTSGINIPYLIIPATHGNIQPFTMSLGLSFDELKPGDELVTIVTTDEQFSLKLALGTGLCPEARLTKNGNVLAIPSGMDRILKIGQAYFLALSILPEKNGFYARWFLDGFLYNSQFIPQSLNGIPDEGQTIIGGGQGFKGIIDELGVYYLTTQKQPSSDPYLFRDAMQRKFTSGLFFANGFDSYIIPAEVKTEGNVHADGINLQLDSRALFTLPAITIKKEPLWIFIEFDKQQAIRCRWQEKGIIVTPELKPENEKDQGMDVFLTTKVLMLNLDSNQQATVHKPALQNNKPLSGSWLRQLCEDSMPKRNWEQAGSLTRPEFNNHVPTSREFSFVIENTLTTPLYIDNILVYTE